MNKSELTPLWKVANSLIIHLIYRQNFPVETSYEGLQIFIISLLYSQQARRGAFMPLTSNEVINEQLTQLFERTNSFWRYLTKPHSCWPFKGGWEGLTHYLI